MSGKSRTKRTRAGRALRLALKITAGLVGLVLLLVAGLLIWLRTSHAEKFIANLVTEQLANQGLFLKMAEFDGPLPGRLHIKGLELADAKGVWLSLDELELQVRLRSLLLRRLEVETLHAAGPALFRLPELPPSPPPPPEETAGGPLTLPVSIRLADVDISDGHIGPGILEMLGQLQQPEQPGEGEPRALTLPRMTLSVQGGASLSQRGISADLAAAALHDDGSGFRLSLYTGPLSPEEIEALQREFPQAANLDWSLSSDEHGRLRPELPEEGGATPLWPLAIQGRDYLKLDISASEAQGGLLAFLSGQPDFPAYALTLDGVGTPQDWRGLINIKADKLVDVEGGFELTSSGNMINFERILDDRLSAGLRLRARPLEGVPGQLRALAAPQVTLEAAARWNVNKGFLDLVSLESEGWQVALRAFELNDSGGVTRLRGHLQTRLDEQGFGKLLGHDTPAAASAPEAGAAALPNTLSTDTGIEVEIRRPTAPVPVTAGTAAAAAPGQAGQSISLNLAGLAAAGFEGQDLPLTYALNGEFAENSLNVSTLSLHGLGLNLTGNGGYNLDQGKALADLRLTSRDNTPWRPWLENMLQAPGILPGGDVELALRLESDELASLGDPAAGDGKSSRASLELQGRNMTWPAQVPAGILGADTDIRIALDGSAHSAYDLSVDRLESGIISLEGGGKVFSPLDRLRLDLNLVLRLASLEPLLAGSAFSEAPAEAFRPPYAVDDYTWPANLNGQPLPNKLDGQPGAILEVAAEGALDNLDLDLLLQLADLYLPSKNVLGSPSFRIVTQRQAGQPGMRGRIDLTAIQRPGGPLSLGGDWAFNPAEAGGLSAALSQLEGKANGILLQADLQLKMPDNAPPRLAGGGQLKIDNWRTIDAFTGARISGQPAQLDFKLEPSADPERGQSLTAGWKAGSVSLYQASSGTQGIQSKAFDLSSMEGELEVTRLFRLPRVQLDLTAGRGSAGVLRWRSGLARVSTEQDLGKFEMALYGWRGSRSTQAQGAGQSVSVNDGQSAGPGSGRSNGQSNRQNGQNGQTRQSGQRGQGDTTPRPGSELVVLGGSFNLAGPSLDLEKFELHSSDRSSNVILAAPAHLDFSQGIQLQELKLDLSAQAKGDSIPLRRRGQQGRAQQAAGTGNGNGRTEKGSLTASAEMVGDRAQVQLNIQKLPFQIASLFMDGTVPEGTLDLGLSLDKQGSRLRGNLTASSAFYPSAEALLAASPEAATILSSDNTEIDKAATQASSAGFDANTAREAVTLVQTIQNTPLLLKLEAHFDENPSNIFPRAQLTRMAGVTRLIVHGDITYAAAPEGSRDGTIDIDLPLRVGQELVPTLDTQVPLMAHIKWQGPLAVLWRLVPIADRELGGFGSINLGLFGSLQDPRYWGRAYLVDGRFEDKIQGILIQDITMEARGNSRRLDLLLSATDGDKGSLAVQGALHSASDTGAYVPAPEGRRGPGQRGQRGQRPQPAGPTLIGSAEPPHLTLRGQIRSLAPLHRDDLSLQISGILGAKGPLSGLDLSARIDVERAEYRLLKGMGGGVTTLEITDPATEAQQKQESSHTLNAEVNIPGRVYVRGYGLDSEWRGNVKAVGPVSALGISGQISPVRGYFDIFSKPFEFSGGGVTFDGGTRINPGLDLDLTYNGPNITAIIEIYGTASKPRFNLSSRPPLPQDQILSQVLFGKSLDNLSNYEAIQLANGLRVLSGEGNLDLLGSVRDTLGVDMLRISGGSGQQQRNTYGTLGASDLGGGASSSDSGDEDSIPKLEAGKYITDKVYVGVEQGVTEDSSSVRVEVELRPNISLQGRSSTQSSEVGLGWKMDY